MSTTTIPADRIQLKEHAARVVRGDDAARRRPRPQRRVPPEAPSGYLYGMARKPQGRFLGMPYNAKRPKRADVGKGVWDPDDRRILTPKNYGWGYGINFSALLRRLTGR
jgi:Family of unknown function (DUF5808)